MVLTMEAHNKKETDKVERIHSICRDQNKRNTTAPDLTYKGQPPGTNHQPNNTLPQPVSSNHQQTNQKPAVGNSIIMTRNDCDSNDATTTATVEQDRRIGDSLKQRNITNQTNNSKTYNIKKKHITQR